jgi:hypothetical protein
MVNTTKIPRWDMNEAKDHLGPSLLLTGTDTIAGFPRMRARVTVIMGNHVSSCQPRLVCLDGETDEATVAGFAVSFFLEASVGEHF